MASLISGQPVTSVSESKRELPSSAAMESRKGSKLGMMSGVYVPVFLNIISILMFLRFGVILGQIGFIGMMGMCAQQKLVTSD
jgi:solute carrier family 12 (potassium/chloride transporters), member 9